jgi:hypothetical protein
MIGANLLDPQPAIGEIAVVTDAMEAVGQDVEQEAADELVGAEGHHLLYRGGDNPSSGS